jgi:hypothetical protein
MTDDDAVIARLREAARTADPEPPELAGSARAAFGLYRFDQELAELLHDSADELTGVRGGPGTERLVSFAAGDIGAEVQITRSGDGYEVTGMVTGDVTAIALQTPTTRRELALDPSGRFHGDSVDGPAVRLEVVTGTGYTVMTPWVTVT